VPKVVSIVFNGGGKVYHFDAGELDLAVGDRAIVSTARGSDIGRVVKAAEESPAGGGHQNLKRVIRKASESDLEQMAVNDAACAEALVACREVVAELKLTLKPVAAEITFDGGKLTISFFAEERIDFREVVSRLSDRLGRRVELRQVSARDEARLVGGYGPCGRGLCCATFSGDQEPVSIRMAKDQNLPLNPSKISGGCGRLMCCLKYEHGVYVGFKKRAPKRGAVVQTPAGEGKVKELLAPADSVVVDLGDGQFVTCRLAELGGQKEDG
jgi:cell fate regulator YaaT (PSP1 superfamily)